MDTRLGERLRGGIALSHRFGAPSTITMRRASITTMATTSTTAEAHRHTTWDAFIELSGEWEGRQALRGEVELGSGGASIWLAPGSGLTLLDGYTGCGIDRAAALGRTSASFSHPDDRYRVTISVGRAF